MTLTQRLVSVVPSKRQLDFQELEFYAFVHFTVNTFTGNEWGDGHEDEAIFNPVLFDAEQWLNAIKSAGMKGLILTCKHHDGFCLWPSKVTTHTVEYSPFKRDIVGEVVAACKKHGVKFGVYLSPWDRNASVYGQGKAYDDFFVSQLTELLTGYGDVFSVWFDGACGEGPNGKKQYYDWDRYYSVIRELQPGACINVCGPDIRWCGNEAGYTREAEWSVVPARTRDTEKIMENSQQEDNEEFRQRKIHAWDGDLGSREILKDELDLVWYPAEVNTSIRPGWFYHDYEDEKVRTLEDLMHVYYNSVGGNATFLLNIPPMPTGLFHKNDVKRLAEIGEYIKKAFANNIAPDAEISADSFKEGNEPNKLLTDTYDSCYFAEDETANLTFKWDEAKEIGHIVIKENILYSQRVERYVIEALIDGEYKEIARGTVIGHKKIIKTDGLVTDSVRIKFVETRAQPAISFVGIYSK